MVYTIKHSYNQLLDLTPLDMYRRNGVWQDWIDEDQYRRGVAEDYIWCEWDSHRHSFVEKMYDRTSGKWVVVGKTILEDFLAKHPEAEYHDDRIRGGHIYEKK